MKDRLKFLVKFVFAFLFFSVHGCSHDTNKKPSTAISSSPNIFRICLQTEPLALHPAYGCDTLSQVQIRALFEGLMRINADGSVGPGIAESFDLSDNKTTYLFHLRDALWSNGEQVTASDFAYAWKKIIAYESSSNLSDLFYLIKNAKAVKKQSAPIDDVGIKVINSKTLCIELEHPAPYFLHLLTNPIFSPICQAIEIQNPNWHAQGQFVCNGPFSVKERSSRRIILEKNTLYHDATHVQLDEVHIQFVNDPNTMLFMFEQGELDWIGEPFGKIPLDAIPSFLKKKQLSTFPVAGVYWLICNTESFPLLTANIRKAIAYAIHRKAITDHVLVGHKAAFSITPDMLSCLDVKDRTQDQNLQLARDYFQKGLSELHLTVETFPTIECSYAPHQKALAQIIQEQLRSALGIKINLICSDWNICFQNYTKKQFQIGFLGWFSFFDDPIYHLQVFREKSNSCNWCSWENLEYQKLLVLADHELDESIRKTYLRDAERLLLAEMPVIPLYYALFKFVKGENFRSPIITRFGDYDLKWVSKAF